MLHLSDLKKIENISDNEKEKLLKKYNMTDIKDIQDILNGAICISPNYIYLLGAGPRTNLYYVRYDITRPPGYGYTSLEDKDLISEMKFLSLYMDNINMKIMTKKVLTIDIDPYKEIDKILEIANEFFRFFDINRYIMDEMNRDGRIMFHPSYLLGEYLIDIYAISFSTSKTSLLLRKIKYLDMVWKAIDGLYWKDILRNYYEYPGEDFEDWKKRGKKSIVRTMAKGELEIKYGDNWSNLSSKISSMDKEEEITRSNNFIEKTISYGGNLSVMGEDFGYRYKNLLYDDIETVNINGLRRYVRKK